MARKRARFAQLRNPKTGRYVKVDRERGVIIAHKRTKGPYKGVPIARRRRNRERSSGD